MLIPMICKKERCAAPIVTFAKDIDEHPDHPTARDMRAMSGGGVCAGRYRYAQNARCAYIPSKKAQPHEALSRVRDAECSTMRAHAVPSFFQRLYSFSSRRGIAFALMLASSTKNQQRQQTPSSRMKMPFAQEQSPHLHRRTEGKFYRL